jgi:hypothetical protein
MHLKMRNFFPRDKKYFKYTRNSLEYSTNHFSKGSREFRLLEKFYYFTIWLTFRHKKDASVHLCTFQLCTCT